MSQYPPIEVNTAPFTIMLGLLITPTCYETSSTTENARNSSTTHNGGSLAAAEIYFLYIRFPRFYSIIFWLG